MAAERALALRAALLLALAALGGGASLARADEAKEPAAAPAGESPAAGGESTPEGGNFYFTQGADGQIDFTQVLRWEGDPQALEYRFVLRAKGADQSAPAIVDERTSAAEERVKLAPGDYEYKIVTFNLLGKAEAESDWIGFSVVKAELPTLAEAKPSTIYMDALDGRVTLSGDKLLPDGVVTLLPKDGSAPFKGSVVKHGEDKEIVVVFPDRAYAQGDYGISFRNPGGLTAKIDDALSVKFQRPVDILLSLGYAPYVSLKDSWLVQNWPTAFNPVGFNADLDLYFVKKWWGFIGIEPEFSWRRMKGGETGATITSDYLLAGANALFKYRFTRSLHGLVRLGGGISRSHHAFDYDGFDGPTIDSTDPYARFGLALQYFTPIKLYGELGADFTDILLLHHYAMGITPRACIGYKLY